MDEIERLKSLLQEFSLDKQQEEAAILRTPKFPVDSSDTDVELRKQKYGTRSPRSQTIHVMHEAVTNQTSDEKRNDGDIRIACPLKLKKNGETKKVDRGHLWITHDGTMTVIRDNSESPERIATDLKINKRTNKTLELSDAANNLYRIQVDNGKQIETTRARSNSLSEKPESKTIHNILMKLLKRRSDRNLLEKRGILKNEPIFGNSLTFLYRHYRRPVPEFVEEAIRLIEENVKSEHIYRTSGNLAIIQKIRFRVDKNDTKILEEYRKEVDVLTGSLKLFFRELKEPLIPLKAFEALFKLLEKKDGDEKNRAVRNAINKIETPHRETLLRLVQHLVKVESYHEDNKMTMHSLSIVWGPSLLWFSEEYSAGDLMTLSLSANTVLELILNTYKNDPGDIEEGQARNEIRLKNETGLSPIDEDDDKRTATSAMGKLQEAFGLKKSESRDKLFGSNASLSDTNKENLARLDLLPKREHSDVPELIHRITEQVEKNLEIKDLYMERGNRDRIAKLKKKNARSKFDFGRRNIHDVTSFLKELLFELKEPLIPKEFFEEFMDNYGKIDQRRQKLESNIETLNKEHRATLEHLVLHFLRVVDKQDVNKVSLSKMSIVFAQIFYRPQETQLARCVQFMDTLFEIYDRRRKKGDVQQSPPSPRVFEHSININKSGERIRVEYKRSASCETLDSSEKLVVNDSFKSKLSKAELNEISRCVAEKAPKRDVMKKYVSYYDNVET